MTILIGVVLKINVPVVQLCISTTERICFWEWLLINSYIINSGYEFCYMKSVL